MREEFCTITDLAHLPQLLVLYRSLDRVCDAFGLSVLCMDTASEACLGELRLPHVVPIPLAQLERDDPELARVRATRTHREYCWTAKSALCVLGLQRERGVEMLTLLDADLMFFSSPEVLFDELGGGSVLLVRNRHGFKKDILRLSPPPLDAPEWSRAPAPLKARLDWVFGPYNAGMVTFKNDGNGRAAAAWWRARSIERCSSRFDGRSFGEQRYLGDLGSRFTGVAVSKHPGAGPSPGGTEGHQLERRGDDVLIDGRPLVFFHYESLTVHPQTTASRLLGAWPLPGPQHTCARVARYFRVGDYEWELLFRPYLLELDRAIGGVSAIEPRYLDGLEPMKLRARIAHQALVVRMAGYRAAARTLPYPARRFISSFRRRLASR